MTNQSRWRHTTVTAMLGLGAIFAFVTGCVDHPSPTGPNGYWNGLAPTLQIRNESSSTIRVFPWIGKVDAFDESGSSHFREKPVFDVKPGDIKRVGMGSPHWTTSGQDGIVRVGVLQLTPGRYPTVEEFARDTRWFEFEQPHPYDLRVWDGDGGVPQIESMGVGGLIELDGGGG